MAQRAIREYDCKKMLATYWQEYISTDFGYSGRIAIVEPETDLDSLPEKHEWLADKKLVVKPDQLFGKRGMHELVKINLDFNEVKNWVRERMNTEITIQQVTDKLTHFIIEPFIPHADQFYVAIKSNRGGETIYFSSRGGIDIESVWDTVATIEVGVLEDIAKVDIDPLVPLDIGAKEQEMLADFIRGLYRFYRSLGFTYLEINPFVIADETIVPLDLVARLDDTAQFECAQKWCELSFPAPFGRKLSKEEEYIKKLDAKSGASLKLTIFNPNGRIWALIAGGGASVIYTDTIIDLGCQSELANYGEYSGNPSTDETYEYAKTILDLMTRTKDAQGRPKCLLIGGGIANFTDVARTFEGISLALTEYKHKLHETNVKIFVRRGGPNYQEGLRKMKSLGQELDIPIEVYGPETHMTKIVNMALN